MKMLAKKEAKKQLWLILLYTNVSCMHGLYFGNQMLVLMCRTVAVQVEEVPVTAVLKEVSKSRLHLAMTSNANMLMFIWYNVYYLGLAG